MDRAIKGGTKSVALTTLGAHEPRLENCLFLSSSGTNSTCDFLLFDEDGELLVPTTGGLDYWTVAFTNSVNTLQSWINTIYSSLDACPSGICGIWFLSVSGAALWWNPANKSSRTPSGRLNFPVGGYGPIGMVPQSVQSAPVTSVPTTFVDTPTFQLVDLENGPVDVITLGYSGFIARAAAAWSGSPQLTILTQFPGGTGQFLEIGYQWARRSDRNFAQSSGAGVSIRLSDQIICSLDGAAGVTRFALNSYATTPNVLELCLLRQKPQEVQQWLNSPNDFWDPGGKAIQSVLWGFDGSSGTNAFPLRNAQGILQVGYASQRHQQFTTGPLALAGVTKGYISGVTVHTPAGTATRAVIYNKTDASDATKKIGLIKLDVEGWQPIHAVFDSSAYVNVPGTGAQDITVHYGP